MKNTHKGGFIHIILFVVIVGIITASGYLYYSNQKNIIKAPTNLSVIYNTSSPVSTPTPTPMSDNVITNSCSNNTLGIAVAADSSWTCKSDDKNYSLELTSGTLRIFITSLGRGSYCSAPDSDPSSPRYEANPDPTACVIKPFFKNSLMDLSLYLSFGDEKEIFGSIENGPSVSVSSSNKLSAENKTKIKTLLQSISKI